MKAGTLGVVALLGVGLIGAGVMMPRGIGLAPIDSPLTMLCLVSGVVLLFASLAAIPGVVADQRQHPNAKAIGMCSIVGVFFPPLWLVALIWAHTGPDPD